MPTKPNGDWIPGILPVPSNLPDPFAENVNTQPMNSAYGDPDESPLEDSEDL